MDDGGAPDRRNSPDFTSWFGDSCVKGADGRPLIVYRGEHGLASRRLQTRQGSLSFGDLHTAIIYAAQPNDRRADPIARAPHVIPALLSIQRPLIEDPADPFLDFARVEDVLGRNKAEQIARDLAMHVTNTNLWDDEFAGTFESVDDLLARSPERLRELYVEAYRVLDEPEYVQWFRSAGFDGAVVATTGIVAGRPEYRVFSEGQIRSAIDPSVAFHEAPSVPGRPEDRAPSTYAADYIREKDGTPRVFFRGEESGDLYLRFDPRQTREGVGFFFAENNLHGAKYAAAGKVGPRAFHVRSGRLIDLTDPYAPDARRFLKGYEAEFDEWIDRATGEPTDPGSLLDAGQLYHYESWGGERWKHLFRYAGRMGFDAVRCRDSTDGVPDSVVVVAMQADQVEFAPANFSAAPRTESPAFQKWFGASTVRDPSGAPQIVYHGTAADFTEFDKRKAADRLGRQLELGWGKGKFYFTTSGESAGVAALGAQQRRLGPAPHVMPVFLRIEKPMPAQQYQSLIQSEVDHGRSRDQAIATVDRRIRYQGFDGIVDPVSGGLAVFSPEQIKSALGNPGTFSRESASILTSLSEAPATRTQRFLEWFRGSKIIDERGEPMRVFHGTRAARDFDAFRARHNDMGSHFGTAGQANDRLDCLARPGATLGPARVLPVFLAIRNPLRLPDLGAWDVENVESALREIFPELQQAPVRFGSTAHLREFLEDRGYDGIVYRNTGETEGSAPLRAARDEALANLNARQSRLGRPVHSFSLDDQQSPEYRAFHAADQAYQHYREANAEDSYIAFHPAQIKSALTNSGDYSWRSRSILASTTAAQSNDAFQSWFGRSSAIDASGKPLVLYHGTTSDFTVFDRQRANIECHFGRGFYFTNNTEDLSENYAGQGPDLTNKMETMVERLADRLYDDANHVDLGYDELRAKARAQVEQALVQHEGVALPVHLSLQNPAIIGGRNETVLHLERDEDADTVSGSLWDFAENLRIAAGRYHGGNIQEAIDTLMLEVSERDGDITLREAIDVLRTAKGMTEWMDDDGYVAGSEIIRDAIERCDYDGIIDRTPHTSFKGMKGLTPSTTHFIVFRSTQIKSALGNAGSFDPSDPDILHSLVRDPSGEPRAFFLGASGGGFHTAQTISQRELRDDAQDVFTPSSERAPSSYLRLRRPLTLDWTDSTGAPQPAHASVAGFANLADAARSARLAGHDGLVVHGLSGADRDGRALGPVSFVAMDPAAERAAEDAPDRVRRQIAAAFKRMARDEQIAGLLLREPGFECGPFDGGCRVVAKALIAVAGRGELAHLANGTAAQHVGARIDGVIYDFAGARGDGAQWIERFAAQERLPAEALRVQDGDAPGLPDSPDLVAKLASRIRGLGLNFDAPPALHERFSAWFGKSIVRTSAGTPRVVFHGTGTPGFELFDEAKRGAVTGCPDAKQGFFFAENPRSAEQFMWRDGEKSGAIYPVYLRIENPLIVDDFTLHAGTTHRAAERLVQARAAGHDGVVFRKTDMLGHEGEVYVPFAASQIKSAIGNRGLYQVDDPSILASSARPSLDPRLNVVVDPGGRARVLYHGTASPSFSRFDTRKEGAHFGSIDQAQSRLERVHGGDPDARLIAVTLDLKHPLRLPDLGRWDQFQTVFGHLGRTAILDGDASDRVWAQWQQSDDRGWASLKQELRLKGYDSIVYANAVEGEGDSYIAFESEQICPLNPAGPDILSSYGRVSVSTQLESVIDRHPQERCTAREWQNLLPRWKGVNADDLVWSGLDAWLGQIDRCSDESTFLHDDDERQVSRRHPHGDVSRSELLQYLARQDVHTRSAIDAAGRITLTLNGAVTPHTHHLEVRRTKLWSALEADPEFPSQAHPAAQVRWAVSQRPAQYDAFRSAVHDCEHEDLHRDVRYSRGAHLEAMRVHAQRLPGGVLRVDRLELIGLDQESDERRSDWRKTSLRETLLWAAGQGYDRVSLAPDVLAPNRSETVALERLARHFESRFGPSADGAVDLSVTAAMQRSARQRQPLYRHPAPPALPIAAPPSHGSDVLIAPALRLAEQRLAERGQFVSLEWGRGDNLRMLTRVAAAFGRRLAPFHQRAGQVVLSGFVLPDDPKTVYVNTNSPYALRAILGHEVSHSVFLKDRRGYEALMQIARKHHTGRSPLTEETLCDFIGQKFTDARFMLAIEEAKPSLFKRCVAGLRHACDVATAALRGTPDLHEAHAIRDCKEMSAAAAALLREHLHRPGMGPTFAAYLGPMDFGMGPRGPP